MKHKRNHKVAVVAFGGVIVGDLSAPLEIIGQPQLPYDVEVCSERPQVQSRFISLSPPHRLDAIQRADTIIVPGIDDVTKPVPPLLIAALREASEAGKRIASICTGAFILAAAGLLDDKRATTHWAAAEYFADMFPNVELDADVLFVDHGNLLTSAGAAAGFDLCLHLVRRDLGAEIAANVARMAVMAPERLGGQAQFIQPTPPAMPEALAPLLVWLEEHLCDVHSLSSIAKTFGMSSRTLHRRFTNQLGTTPLKWLTEARVRRAQAHLECSDLSIEQIAEAVGFGSSVTLRQRFASMIGISPSAYRASFRSFRSFPVFAQPKSIGPSPPGETF